MMQSAFTILHPGEATGRVLVLSDSLSFWGGFNPKTGEIIDQHHPERGMNVRGCVLVIPSSRGSAGTPAGVAESIRTGNGPVAVILGNTDVNIAIGAMVADRLYGTSTPVIVAQDLKAVQQHANNDVTVSALDSVTIHSG